MNRILAACVVSAALAVIGAAYGFADAQADYKAKCAACHGAHGAGDTVLGKSMKIRGLGSEEVQKQSDEKLTEIISKGEGRGKMPAYDKKLSPAQISDLVKWIRTLKK